MQPPEGREKYWRDTLPQAIWRAAKRARRAGDVVALKSGFGERTAQADLVFGLESACLQR